MRLHIKLTLKEQREIRVAWEADEPPAAPGQRLNDVLGHERWAVGP